MSDGIPRTPKEALATAVGLGLLTAQRLQVRQRQLRREVRTQLPEYAGRLEEVAERAEERLQPLFTELEARLPATGPELADQGRSLVSGVRRQLRAWAADGSSDASP